MKKITLTKDDFEFLCPMKIADMKSIEEGYFCDKCEKKVHDVTNFTNSEFQELKRNSKDVCVTFKKVVTLGAMLSFSACSSVTHTSGKVAQSNQDRVNAVHTVDTINPQQEIEGNLAGGISVAPQENNTTTKNLLKVPIPLNPHEEVEAVIAVGMPVEPEPPMPLKED